MPTPTGWRMVTLRLPTEALDVLDELAAHLPNGPAGRPSRSTALIWALLHLDSIDLPDNLNYAAWHALHAHTETLGLGLD